MQQVENNRTASYVEDKGKCNRLQVGRWHLQSERSDVFEFSRIPVEARPFQSGCKKRLQIVKETRATRDKQSNG